MYPIFMLLIIYSYVFNYDISKYYQLYVHLLLCSFWDIIQADIFYYLVKLLSFLLYSTKHIDILDIPLNNTGTVGEGLFCICVYSSLEVCLNGWIANLRWFTLFCKNTEAITNTVNIWKQYIQLWAVTIKCVRKEQPYNLLILSE